MGMKSFSTMSITAEMEREDKIRELETVVDDQRSIIEHQNQRIHELEAAVHEISQHQNQVFADEESNVVRVENGHYVENGENGY